MAHRPAKTSKNCAVELTYRGWKVILTPGRKNTRAEFSHDKSKNHLIQSTDLVLVQHHVKACIDVYTGNFIPQVSTSAHLTLVD